MNLRLLLLTLCQGMLLINNVVFIAVNGLVGLALAPTAWLATLPITAYVAGGAAPSTVAGLSGPEGGLAPTELAAAAAAGFLPTTLGARVLRADTAPLAALAAIAALESPA